LSENINVKTIFTHSEIIKTYRSSFDKDIKTNLISYIDVYGSDNKQYSIDYVNNNFNLKEIDSSTLYLNGNELFTLRYIETIFNNNQNFFINQFPKNILYDINGNFNFKKNIIYENLNNKDLLKINNYKNDINLFCKIKINNINKYNIKNIINFKQNLRNLVFFLKK
jgi:hypothetical protein